jgi:hypothetical protein
LLGADFADAVFGTANGAKEYSVGRFGSGEGGICEGGTVSVD